MSEHRYDISILIGPCSQERAEQALEELAMYTQRSAIVGPGAHVTVRDALGQLLPRRAITGVVPGHDFPVVWVCGEEEWEAAREEGREPEDVPWPAEDVLRPGLFPGAALGLQRFEEDDGRAVSGDVAAVLIFATRYALGRRTYAPYVMRDALQRRARELSERDVDILIGDIEGQAKHGYGDPCDEEVWLDTRSWLRSLRTHGHSATPGAKLTTGEDDEPQGG